MSDNTEDRLFAVRLLLESRHPDEENVEPLFEDRILVVEAPDDGTAEARARVLTASEPVEYLNTYGNRVSWTLLEVLDVKELVEASLHDGMEVYYSLLDSTALEHVRQSLRTSDLTDGDTP